MNNSRRSTFRRNRNVPQESTQNTTQFVQRKPKDFVEIEDEDDDEVQDLTDQFAFKEEELKPRQVKRRKKQLTVKEDSDNDEDDLGSCMDEKERRQIEEALRQSRLEIEVESKRRAAYSKPGAVKLTSGVKKGNSSKDTCIEDESLSDNETQDDSSGNDMQSSPTSFDQVKDQLERAESPDLFGSPRSSMETEELGNRKEKNTKNLCKSPLRSNRIFTADEVKKSTLDKDIIINITPVKRHFDGSKNKLKLKKKDTSKEQEKEVGITSKAEVNLIEDTLMESKKRKYCPDDEDDKVGHNSNEDKRLVPNTKKQKLIKQVFNVRKKDEQLMTRTCTTHVVINDDDDDEDDEDEDDEDANGDDADNDGNDVRLEDIRLLTRRKDAPSKDKKIVKRKLERSYKKPKLSIKSVKDAVKAKLYFAPPGIEPKTYTYAIMRMMDHARKRVYKAQRKSLNFIKWGKPVVVGPRELNSLDARKEKRKNIADVASTSTSTNLGTSDERKRSLRSARPTVSVPPIKTEADADIEDTARRTRDFINSDDSDEELTIPVFGEAIIKPKSWKEYLPNKETETFGENVVTSAECKETSLEENAFNKDSPSTSKPSCSLNINARRSVERNKDECINGKRDKTHEKLKNKQEDSYLESLLTSKNINDKSPTKSKENLNNKQTEALGNKKENSSPCKPMTSQDTRLFEVNDKDDDDIESSIDIGINHSKRHVKKALIEDMEEEEEGHDSLSKFGIEVTDEIMTGSSQTDAEPAQDSNPGTSMENVAAEKSGYLKCDRTSKKPAGVQRVMSSAAKRAADAAVKRMEAASVSSSPEISSSIEPSQAFVSNTEDNRVKCPMCFEKFSKEDIEVHAATCDGSNPKPSYLSSSKPSTSSLSQKSIGSTSDNKDFQLKNLKIMVTRSPEAQRKLMEQRNLSASKARRSLRLNNRSTGADSASDNKDEEARKSRKYIDMTTDEEDDTKTESQDEKETVSSESSQSFHWFSSTSQVERQKNKFKVTYGAKKKNNLEPRKTPFSTLDFIPLEAYPSSSEVECCDDAGNQKSDDNDESDCEKPGQKKGGRSDDGSGRDGASNSQTMPKDQSESHNKCDEIDSDSNESDMEMLASYGVKVQSKKRKRENKEPKQRNINDVLGPQKQEKPKQKRKKTFESFDEDDYENEMTLLELSSMPIKRSTVENKSIGNGVVKRRRRRISSSDESEYETCFICTEKVAKEDFTDHTDACLERKGEAFDTTGKDKTVKTTNRSTTNQPKTASSEQTIEMDSDEIGDSPIKTFKLIGEDTGSCVDFRNQFSFFNNKGGKTKRGDTDTGMSKKRYKGGKFGSKGRHSYKRGRGKRKR